MNCTTCGKRLYSNNKTGFCRACYESESRIEEYYCKTCGEKISRYSKSGLCRSCWNKQVCKDGYKGGYSRREKVKFTPHDDLPYRFKCFKCGRICYTDNRFLRYCSPEHRRTHHDKAWETEETEMPLSEET